MIKFDLYIRSYCKKDKNKFGHFSKRPNIRKGSIRKRLYSVGSTVPFFLFPNFSATGVIPKQDGGLGHHERKRIFCYFSLTE